MLLGPRFALFALLILSDWVERAYETIWWPILGFFFLPWTTLAYAYAHNEGDGLKGPYLALWVVALIADLFSTRKNSTKDSAVRVRADQMMHGKPEARAVDAEVIDIDRED